MACPYFYPVERFDDQTWVKPPRLPLGDACRGLCRAASDEAFQPDVNQQQQLCNRGYARGRCARFPGDAEADAVRFSIESDDGDRVEVVYVYEKNWAPLRYGRVECSSSGRFEDQQFDPLLRRQLEFFTLSYLERRNRGRTSASGAARSSTL